MINQVVKFQNGIVMVFDEKGEQMTQYQGQYEEVKAKILADAPESAGFFHGAWNAPLTAVCRKEW